MAFGKSLIMRAIKPKEQIPVKPPAGHQLKKFDVPRTTREKKIARKLKRYDY